MRKSGFTLIELMIVVAIIAILAALAIPLMLRARIQANEAAAVSNIKTITGAQVTYMSSNNAYAQNFDSLTTLLPPYLFGTWDGSPVSGYLIAMNGDGTTYVIDAAPADVGGSGVNFYYTDPTGVIHVNEAGVAGPNDPVLGE